MIKLNNGRNMKKNFKKIIGKKVNIRLPRLTDAKAMFTNWAADDEVTKTLTWFSHTSLAISEMVLQMWVSGETNTFNWIIENKINEEAIGAISLFNVDYEKKTCEIGYCLSKKFWNQGIMSEAVYLILGYAVKKGMKQIIGFCFSDNLASKRVMEKNGMNFFMQKEAMNPKKEGEKVLLDYYVITNSEYKKRGKNER